MAFLNASNTSTSSTISISSVRNQGGSAAASGATSFTGQSNVSLSFEYLPESMSFGINAVYQVDPVAFTAAQRLTFQNSKIDDIRITVKVVAGCNNAIVRTSTNEGSAGWATQGALTTVKSKRNNLITIAKLLYSLVLPTGQSGGGGGTTGSVTSVAEANASSSLGGGNEVHPPATCNLIVGPYCACIGAFQSMNITFNGPYDYDGSPTDMDVDFSFLPSEFYDSSIAFTGVSGADPTAKLTMTSDSSVSGEMPFAVFVGQNTSAPPPGAPASNADNNPPSTGEVAAQSIRAVQAGVAPGTTPTDQQVADLMRSAVSQNKTDTVTAVRNDHPTTTGETTYTIKNHQTGQTAEFTYKDVQAANAAAFGGHPTPPAYQPQSTNKPTNQSQPSDQGGHVWNPLANLDNGSNLNLNFSQSQGPNQ